MKKYLAIMAMIFWMTDQEMRNVKIDGG